MFSLLFRPMEGSARSLRIIVIALTFACFLCVSATPAIAQGFSTDARMIGMGGSDQSSDSTSLSSVTKGYSSFGLPLGLIQLYQHRDSFNQRQSKFQSSSCDRGASPRCTSPSDANRKPKANGLSGTSSMAISTKI